MIKASELRIGNYVINNKGTMFRVLAEDFPTIYHFPQNYFYIRLIEEMLEEFSFEKSKQGFRKGLLEIACTNIDPEHDYWVVAQYDPVDGQCHILPNLEIRYVHELQNLFFVLTREEPNVIFH